MWCAQRSDLQILRRHHVRFAHQRAVSGKGRRPHYNPKHAGRSPLLCQNPYEFVVIGVEGGKGHKGVRRLRCAPALGIAEALHRVLLLAGARITRCPALARRPLQPQTQTSLARSGWCCLALRCAPVKMPNSAAGAAPCVMTHALHHDTAGNPIYPVDIYSDMPASMCRVWVITKRSITASLPRWILAFLPTRHHAASAAYHLPSRSQLQQHDCC